MNEIKEALKNLEIEDFIWIVSLFIAIFAIISNKYERDFLINQNRGSQRNFRTIDLGITIISFFIYFYFLMLTYNNLRKITPETSFKNTLIANASFVATSLFFIGVIIINS